MDVLSRRGRPLGSVNARQGDYDIYVMDADGGNVRQHADFTR